MIAKTLGVALTTSLTLALSPTPAEAGHLRSGAHYADLNVVVGGYAFPYGRHARFYGPGVVINPFVFPDGRVRLNYLRHGALFATDYIGYIDYGRRGQVRGFYTYDGGYYDNSGRYYRRDNHQSYRRYGYNDTYRRGYHYGQGWYDRDGRYHQRYDDQYDRRDRRRDNLDDRHNDRIDQRDDRYNDRDFRKEPYKNGAVPLGGIQSEQFPGQPVDGLAPGATELDDQLDG
ncbi:MAG: hypothetical protein AAF511_00095 [Pseudomonadota bacterium]